MKIIVFDYSGHPFQVQLSRLLAGRGHDVVHGHCEAYHSGRGQLTTVPGDTVRFTSIGAGRRIRKYSFVRRLLQELRLGLDLATLFRRQQPDVVLISNAPIPTLCLAVLGLWFCRTPWVLWHQDVFAAAVGSFAARRRSALVRSAARVYGAAEAWCARRATHIVVITEAFRAVHERWGTVHKTTVITNWAPVTEIVPSPRDNAWASEHGIDSALTLLYSGTLGLKHNPTLLLSLAARIQQRGTEVRLVTVNDGPAVSVLRADAAARGVPIVLLPFQPYERLSEVLGSGDVLVVLLEPDASEFSVPSKALSYLCAGRPIVGLLPATNAAAALIERAGSAVFAPLEASMDAAADWVLDLWADPARRQRFGASARTLAELEFSPEHTANRFEDILLDATGTRQSVNR
ncbi:MAG: glycosyltransferase family 4 protein [Geodermatophilaceae bacterium]|nr:glycosyltransferase family 4 protein [Geodermatophilaceae bacterium]